MGIYILRRLALIIPPTLVGGIMLLNFVIVQAAPPGGPPIEQILAEMEGHGSSALARAGGGDVGSEVASSSGDSRASRGGLPPELLEELEAMYGFDKPAHERFFKMLGDYATFDFGDSFFRDRSVVELILDKMPVSISLGLWSTLIIYSCPFHWASVRRSQMAPGSMSGPVLRSWSATPFPDSCLPSC